jgi:hypothetical protein
MALPIYSWAIHIRDGKVIGIKNKIAINNIEKDINFEQENKILFKVKNDNYKAGSFYKSGDFLKFENVIATDLLEMATDLSDNAKTKPEEIIFYDLDEFNIKNYEKDIFEQVSSQF